MNQLLLGDQCVKAVLVLEDGTVFKGNAAGKLGEAVGEVVFNTSLTGYQEIISDPSYAGQMVTLTYPEIGNYGVCPADMQSDTLHLKGLIVKNMCYTPSSWRSVQSLPEFLSQNSIVAIENIDTRALTIHLRENGNMQGIISTTDFDIPSLLNKVKASGNISDVNYVDVVSPEEDRFLEPTVAQRYKVVAYDCGIKKGIVNALLSRGCAVHMVPWDTQAKDVLAMNPDGVFFSNGPGDPRGVDATAQAMSELLGKVPVFGICLGSQMMGMAAGAQIEKLHYGHHGGNHPVMNLLTGKVEISAMNHNYGVVFSSFGPIIPSESAGETEHVSNLNTWAAKRIAPVVQTEKFGRVRLTHVNLNDGTPEGFQFLDIPAFAVQYHPEACPGPHDSAYLFDAFCALMAGKEEYLGEDVMANA